MPELPEVETIARGVDERLRGDPIVEVWFGGHREPFKTPPARQAKGLEGRVILAVHRTGKHIVCELGTVDGNLQSHPKGKNKNVARVRHPIVLESTPAAQWIVHLGMTGRLLVTAPDAPVAAHTHARLSLASGRELRFVDPRRFGRLEFRELSRERRLQRSGGRSAEGDGRGFCPALPAKAPGHQGRPAQPEAARRGGKHLRRREPLSRRHPATPAVWPADRSGTGAAAAGARVMFLQDAIRLGGSSVSDYVDADGVRGFFQLEHCVYLRTGLPCRLCQTPIRRIVLAGRGTHYCPKCQM